MRKPTHTAITAVLVLLIALPAVLQADTRIATSRANYEKKLKAIEAKYGGKEANWPDRYVAELKALEAVVQAAGDLDGLLAVRAEASRRTKASANKGSSYYTSSRGTTRSSTIRLQARANRTGVTLKNQTVNIRFFTKPVSARGRVTPIMAGSGNITLPELTSEGVYIDCPEVNTTRTSYSGYYSSSKYGVDFYGIVVSVYNADGSLSYQGMSATGLRNQAAAASKRGAGLAPPPVKKPVGGEGERRWK